MKQPSSYSPRAIPEVTKLFLAGVLTLSFTACASKMTKSDCESTDFYAMGLKDGKNGKNTENLSKATADCQPYGVNVPADRYNYGRQVGLTNYCSNSRASDDADKGAPTGVCNTVPPYQTAYSGEVEKVRKDKAAQLANVQKSQSDLNSQESKLQSDLTKIKQQQQTAPPNGQ